MISLSRKRELARIAEAYASTAQTAAMIGRTGQVSRSTVLIGDADVEIAGGVETAVDTSVTVDAHTEELADAGDIADEVVSTLPDMTEDAWEAENVGQIAADGADWAAEFATELETELDAAKADLENALTDAHNALAEAGQARSEAAQAVADAQSAVAQATDAIQKALDAADLAEGAAPTWATAAPTSGDAAGKPVGAIWYVRDGAGKVVEMWELTAFGWEKRDFSETAIPQVAIGSGTYGSLAGDRLVAKSITAAQIQALAITANELAANSVTAVKIAADSVVAAKIQAGAVTTDKLNALAVTADKLAAGSVIADKIAAGAIVAGKLAATAIDGMTITGAFIRTAPSGARVELNSAGIRVIDEAGKYAATISGSGEMMLLQGKGMLLLNSGQEAQVAPSYLSGSSGYLDKASYYISGGSTGTSISGSKTIDATGVNTSFKSEATAQGSFSTWSVNKSGVGLQSQLNLWVRASDGATLWADNDITVRAQNSKLTFDAATIAFSADTDWVRLDGWSGGFVHSASPVFYRKRLGYVEFKGSMINSTWSGPLTAFVTMPVGFRPAQSATFTLPADAAVSRVAAFNPEGSVGTIRLYGSGAAGAWWTFDMIRYPASS